VAKYLESFMFKLYHAIVMLYDFSREARGFAENASRAAQHEDPIVAANLRRYCRRILGVVIAAMLTGYVVVPIAAVLVAVSFFNVKPPDALARFCVGLLLFIPVSLLHLFVGVAAGCLMVPAEFMKSQAGTIWLDLIGTTSLGGAKLVCILVVLAGIVMMVGQATLLIGMAPIIR